MIMVATFASVVLLGMAEPSSANPDELKALLDRNPTCKDWRDVSRVTLARLRSANATAGNVDLKLLELSFTIMDFCTDELQHRLDAKFAATGLSGGEDVARRTARAFAALIAFYKEALASQQSGTSLKNWPALAAVANSVIPDLRAIIDLKFGEGEFGHYVKIVNTPEKSRTADEQRTFAAMHSWMEPL